MLPRMSDDPIARLNAALQGKEPRFGGVFLCGLLAETGLSKSRKCNRLNVRYAPETGPSRDRLLNYRFVPEADIN